MRITTSFLLLLGVANAAPQNLFSEIKSVFGITSNSKTPTAASLIPPATISSTSTRPLNPTVNTATISVTTRSGSRTDSTLSTITSASRSSKNASSDTTSSSDSSTITSAPTTTSTDTSTLTSSSTTTALPTAATDQPSQSSSSSSSISPAGIAVAVIMTLAILAAIAWLLFRFHPGIRKWWIAREDKKMRERSYREAIDGPFSRGGSGVRSQALGGGVSTSRKSMMASFFAPRTVKLGHGQEIRRKPVNWGARGVMGGHPTTAELPGSGMEKVALTQLAAPMARSASVVSSSSGSANGSSVSSPAATQKELPAVPPMPPIPPVPPIPADKPGDMHRILSRKSIFELA